MTKKSRPAEPVAYALFLGALTLVPYDFSRAAARDTAFFRFSGAQFLDAADCVLNVVLLLPLGAMVQREITARGRGIALALFSAACLAFVLSSVIEFLQGFLPTRDSSAVDVLLNTAGAIAGAWIYGRWRATVTAPFAWLHRQPTPVHAALMAAAVCIVLATSAVLQARTQLSNWSLDYPLLMGNERTGDRAWQGRLFAFELTDAATSVEDMRAFATGKGGTLPGNRLAAFSFASGPPYRDAAKTVPDLDWIGDSGDTDGGGVSFQEGRWLRSTGPAVTLARRLRETSAFTIRIVCATDNFEQNGPARIISNSLDTRHRNFTIGQEKRDLVIRFRTPHTGMNGIRPEVIVPNVFTNVTPQEIVVTYDGSALLAVVSGSGAVSRTELSPGSSLAASASSRDLEAAQVGHYKYAYFILLFAVAGVVLAVKRRDAPVGLRSGIAAVVVFAALLELTLVLTSGRAFHIWNVISSASVGTLVIAAVVVWSAAPTGSAVFRPPGRPVTAGGASPAPSRRIQASSGWSLDLEELWLYRELIYFLVWRDIKVRYRQTVLGAAWAILQPLLTMAVFALFFGRLARVPSDGIPYPLFSFAGLVPWTFFSNGLTQASNSVVQHANLLTKVYFPRMAIPIATVLSGAPDFLLSFGVLLGMMAYFGVAPTSNVIYLPLFVLLAFVSSLGISLWLAALNVQFRDVRFTLPFITQFWLFATPVAYPSSMLSEPWRTFYGINPMVGVVEGFRWALLGVDTAPSGVVGVSALVAVLLLVSGAYYFRRLERTFADFV